MPWQWKGVARDNECRQLRNYITKRNMAEVKTVHQLFFSLGTCGLYYSDVMQKQHGRFKVLKASLRCLQALLFRVPKKWASLLHHFEMLLCFSHSLLNLSLFPWLFPCWVRWRSFNHTVSNPSILSAAVLTFDVQEEFNQEEFFSLTKRNVI